MSSRTSKTKVQQVLEDTGYAYNLSCETEHLNADYADYATTHALGSFQSALHDPQLTPDQLCAMLRKASVRAHARQCKTPWSMFMANYIHKHCNDAVIAARAGGTTSMH